MSKSTALQVTVILALTVIIGIFYNLSLPEKLPFITENKTVDFSQSDSLLLVLKKQDSILRAADSIKNLSIKREDSLKLINEQRIKDSILTSHIQDSIKHSADSVKASKKRIEDSLKALTKDTVIVKPVEIKLDFAKALFDKKYRFIDARDESDYSAGHIQGAVNIPYHKINEVRSRLNQFSKDEVIVVYCGSGCDVSIDMAYSMAHDGYKKVYIFHGGWDDWKAAGYPIN